MTSLLVNEPPLQTLPSLAKKIGLNEAIVLNQVHYWLDPKRNHNVFEGKRWVHNTYEQWQQQFPFWSVSTIRRIFGTLEAQEILRSFPQKEDPQKGKYYTINYKRLKETFPSIDFFKNQEASSPVINLSTSSDQSDHFQEICSLEEGDPSDNPALINLSTLSDQNDHDEEYSGFAEDDQNEQGDQFDQGEVINLITTYKLNTEITNREREEEKKEKNKKKESVEKVFSGSEDEAKLDTPSSLSAFDPQRMVDVWNAHIQIPLYGKEELVRLTPARKVKLTLLRKEALSKENDTWESYCHKIARNRYLMGENARGTRVTFDWAIQVTNARKILEGAIHDRWTVVSQASASYRSDSWSKSDDLFSHYANGILIERDTEYYHQLLQQHCANNGYPDVWFNVCKGLVAQVGQAVFRNWFKDMVPVDLVSSKVKLAVKGLFYRDYINATYAEAFRQALKAALPAMKTFEIEVGGHDPPMSSTRFAGVNVSPPVETWKCP